MALDAIDQGLQAKLKSVGEVISGWLSDMNDDKYDYNVLLPKLSAGASDFQVFVDAYRQDKAFAAANAVKQGA